MVPGTYAAILSKPLAAGNACFLCSIFRLEKASKLTCIAVLKSCPMSPQPCEFAAMIAFTGREIHNQCITLCMARIMNEFYTLFSITPFSWGSIATGLVCGFIIGLERQLRGKPVGIRTSCLIVLGTYIYVASSIALHDVNSDPTRIIGQVVTGVGFLGAGVMMTRDGTVLGVTSAATIWVLAALGICIAVVGNFIAIKLAIVVLGILWGVELLEHTTNKLTRGVHAQIETWKQRNNQNRP